MRKQVILHIGSPKTGTTALQSVLAAEREYLKQKNIAYHQIGTSSCECHWWFVLNFFDDIRDYDSARLDLDRGITIQELKNRGSESLKKVTQEVEENNITILSAEQFLFLPEKVLIRIREFFDSLGVELVVLCYVRDFYDSALSEVNQKVKMGMAKLKDFEQRLPIFPIKQCISRYRNSFPSSKIIVKNYNSIINSNGLISDFSHSFLNSASLNEGVKKGKVNSSLSVYALKVIDMLNEDDQLGPPHSARRDLIIDALKLLPGEKYSPTKAAIKHYLAEVREQVEFLRSEFGIEFHGSISHQTSNNEHVNCEDFAIVLSQILKKLNFRDT